MHPKVARRSLGRRQASSPRPELRLASQNPSENRARHSPFHGLDAESRLSLARSYDSPLKDIVAKCILMCGFTAWASSLSVRRWDSRFPGSATPLMDHLWGIDLKNVTPKTVAWYQAAVRRADADRQCARSRAAREARVARLRGWDCGNVGCRPSPATPTSRPSRVASCRGPRSGIAGFRGVEQFFGPRPRRDAAFAHGEVRRQHDALPVTFTMRRFRRVSCAGPPRGAH